MTKKTTKRFILGAQAGAEAERERIIDLLWGWGKANRIQPRSEWDQLADLIRETAPETKKASK